MGLFPIIMNILQFWLIDSIVKASEDSSFAHQSDTPRPSYEDSQREPLFGVPSDDEDDDDDVGTLSRHDIENPRTRSRSRDETKVSTPEENKSGTSGTTTPGVSEGGTSVPLHAYPPNADNTSTPSSRKGSISPRAGEPRHRYKRTIPAPLRLQSTPQPAVNSPEPSATRPRPTHKSSRSNSTTSVAKAMPDSIPPAVQKEPDKDWASWEDSDDWANRVGEDDWTGKRLEHKKNVLSEAWGPSPVLQQQQHVSAVGS
jgi:hypothetical protein